MNNRAEIALGVDASNVDGKIRPTALTAENAEVAFIMGYDSTGPGWYLRPAAFGTAVTFNAAVSGIWEAMTDVDLAANSGNGSGRCTCVSYLMTPEIRSATRFTR